MNQDKLEKLITKMLSVIKPKGVINIEYKLSPLDFGRYYMDITYVVPDDNEYLRSANMRGSDFIRIKWNEQIKNTISRYFDVDVIINSTGIQSESYNKRQKEIEL